MERKVTLRSRDDLLLLNRPPFGPLDQLQPFFYQIVVPGTLRDSLYILEGLLEQQTSLRPKEIMADTSRVRDIIFGLFWLLGYRFSPRLADIGSARFWWINPQADYGVLNNFAKHRINPDRIKRHWDDMLRVAGSLKLGTVNASELVRSLLKSDKPSGLTIALADIGRIPISPRRLSNPSKAHSF